MMSEFATKVRQDLMRKRYSWFYDTPYPDTSWANQPEAWIKLAKEHGVSTLQESLRARPWGLKTPHKRFVPSWSKQPEKESEPATDNVVFQCILNYCEPYHDTYIEAGGNDGVTQSNTAFLEYMCEWKGILVEPIKALVETAKVCRPGSEVIYGALVEEDFEKDSIEGPFSDKIINDHDNGLTTGLSDHLQEKFHQYMVKVPSVKISDVLSKVDPKRLGFLSLDIEGGELEILKGIDFSTYMPRLVLVEAKQEDTFELEQFMNDNGYPKSSRVCETDLLFLHKDAKEPA